MHFVAGVVREQYPSVLDFVNEVSYLEKAATGMSYHACSVLKYVSNSLYLLPVSLQLLGVDIRQMSKGLKEATKELVENKQNKKLKVSQM